MAFENVDPNFAWSTVEGRVRCPEVVQMKAGDTPFVKVDFGDWVNTNNVSILSAGTITEKDGKTITFSDPSDLSPDRREVSFQVLTDGGADDYTLEVPITYDTGDAAVVTAECILRVVA